MALVPARLVHGIEILVEPAEHDCRLLRPHVLQRVFEQLLLRVVDAVHEAAKSLGYTSLELSGRRDELKQWQDARGQVLAVQISAGGVGVDLTRARYSAYYSLSFSLGEYDQALSRVHRPGQGRPVEHIHLVARGTVDEKILRALEKRAEVVEAILAEIKNS